MLQIIIFSTIAAAMLCADLIYIWKILRGARVWMYAAVTALSVLCALAVGFVLGTGVYGILFNLVMNIILAMAAEDICEKKISNVALAVGTAAGIAASFFVPETTFFWVIIRTAFITAILALVSIKTNQAVGMGDVICMGIISLCTTLSDFMACMITSFFISLLYSAVFLLFKKKNMKTEIALLPFLFFGVIINILF